MKKIVLANLASPANPGDQAILLGTVKLFRRFFPGHELTIVTRAISRKSAYAELNCGVIPSYPNVEWLTGDNTIEKIGRIPKALQGGGLLREAIRNCDYVFLAGGGYFYSYRKIMPGFLFLSNCMPVYWARKFKKKLIFLPQSYGPFHSWIAEKIFSLCLKAADLVCYREEISGERLRKKYPEERQKLVFMPDLALYLKKEEIVSSVPGGTGFIGVTVRAWEEDRKDSLHYLENLAAALCSLHEKTGLKIRIIVQVQDTKRSEGDSWISRLLEEKLKKSLPAAAVEFHEALPHFTVPQIAELYAGCSFLIGMRLHSVLLSFVMGRPALLAGYQHKSEGIFKDLGLEELFLGSFQEISAERIVAAAEKLLKNPEFWNEKIGEALSREYSQIESIFRGKMNTLE